VSGNIILKLSIPKAENLTLRIRIPGWSKQSALMINGEPITKVIPGQYAESGVYGKLVIQLALYWTCVDA
jgi:DUF1680 family protein